jgi:hypothetical protein
MGYADTDEGRGTYGEIDLKKTDILARLDAAYTDKERN